MTCRRPRDYQVHAQCRGCAQVYTERVTAVDAMRVRGLPPDTVLRWTRCPRCAGLVAVRVRHYPTLELADAAS